MSTGVREAAGPTSSSRIWRRTTTVRRLPVLRSPTNPWSRTTAPFTVPVIWRATSGVSALTDPARDASGGIVVRASVRGDDEAEAGRPAASGRTSAYPVEAETSLLYVEDGWPTRAPDSPAELTGWPTCAGDRARSLPTGKRNNAPPDLARGAGSLRQPGSAFEPAQRSYSLVGGSRRGEISKVRPPARPAAL